MDLHFAAYALRNIIFPVCHAKTSGSVDLYIGLSCPGAATLSSCPSRTRRHRLGRRRRVTLLGMSHTDAGSWTLPRFYRLRAILIHALLGLSRRRLHG
jgi:hypothetical protein